MRATAAEKAEVIRLVEGSDLPVKRTLEELNVSRSTFYRWYKAYLENGYNGLEPNQPDLPRAPALGGHRSLSRLTLTTLEGLFHAECARPRCGGDGQDTGFHIVDRLGREGFDSDRKRSRLTIDSFLLGANEAGRRD